MPTLQDQVRLQPVSSIKLPMLMLRGTSDQFSRDKPWEQLQSSLTSKDVQVMVLLSDQSAAGGQGSIFQQGSCQIAGPWQQLRARTGEQRRTVTL